MKRFLFFVIAGVGMAPLASSGPVCASGTLASYILLGSGGCTIGGNVLYDFHVDSGTAGATPIAPSSITITPFGGSYNLGLTESVGLTANAGKQLEAIFTYEISGEKYVGDSVTLSGSSETGDGGVTDIQNYCAGGKFGPGGVTGCTGNPGNLTTLDGVQNYDSSAYGAGTPLSVTDDFDLDGGLGGSASGGTFTDGFTAVPEPFSFLLTGIGIALAAGLKLFAKRTAC
ncbi:MAG: hypothetical protein WB992_02650 [Bryobacteraceae bacterium]